jgi:GH15 family glucan-1,4-alpha-glucosidase
MTDLYQRSIEIILQNQSPTGAYPACPEFPTYQYCWFRDGSFIAYAMNLVGEHESAARFHDWTAEIINTRIDTINRAVEKARIGAPLDSKETLHTRYSLNGQVGEEEWPNFQLDGFGAWLWSLGEHVRISQTDATETWLRAANLMADYVSALWPQPCYDCWEEFPDEVHPYTLAAIYAGLESNEQLNGTGHQATLTQIRGYLLENFVRDGHFVKSIHTNDVDASLLGLVNPFKVFQLDDSRIQTTIAQIEITLRKGGGLHRYPSDTYYGGGEWILLTAWLGWYYAELGEEGKAVKLMTWIEEQADSGGQLAEQIPSTLIDDSKFRPWRERWGDIATPLLWSHAKYLILYNALESQD